MQVMRWSAVAGAAGAGCGDDRPEWKQAAREHDVDRSDGKDRKTT